MGVSRCHNKNNNDNNNNTNLASRKPKLQGQITKYKLNYALNDSQNRYVLKYFLKVNKDCAEVTSRG